MIMMIMRSNTVSVGARHRQNLEASHIPNPSPPPRADHARPDKRLDTTYRQLEDALASDASPEAAEELAEVTDKQVRGVVGGPVAAAVEFAPGDDVRVVALGEPADRSEVESEAR